MEITCQSCGGRFNLPDEKIPENARFAAQCPKCPEKIIVDTRQRPSLGPDLINDETALALICQTGLGEGNRLITDAVMKLGLRPVVANTMANLIANFDYNRFVLVIMEDNFGGPNNPGLKYLEKLQSSIRRDMVIGLISRQIPTLDTMRAFSLSIDFIINEHDLATHFYNAARKTIRDHEQFYKAYKECQKEMGIR